MFYKCRGVSGLTDLSWSPCGNILMASSSDGFCSIVTFSAGELGQLYEEQTDNTEQQKQKQEEREEKMETDNDLKLELEETQPQPEQPPAPTQTSSSVAAPSDGKKRVPLVTLISGAENVRQGGGGATPEKPKGRRIDLITISSPKTKT